jgi:hypothetical protein
VPETGCFGAGFEICSEEMVAGFVAVAALEEFDTVELAGFGVPDGGAAVDFICPGISDDAVTG